MHKTNIEMSYEHAVNIVSTLLDALQFLFEQHQKPLKLSHFDDILNEDNFCPDNLYSFFYNNRYFEITFYDDPDELGYCSLLDDYDPSTYVLCDITERRINGGEQKYQMTFGFDILKRTFLELFEVLHYNAVGILREYPNYESQLESDLQDVVII